MLFEMRRVKNGCILKVTLGENETTEQQEVVYQEKYDDEVECFADFLRHLDTEYDPSANRYSEKRIYITVKPGDKFIPQESRKDID